MVINCQQLISNLVKIHFRQPETTVNTQQTADTEFRISQLGSRINWLVDKQRLIKENNGSYTENRNQTAPGPALYNSHLAWADVKFTRSNSLVLDPYRCVDNLYYYHYNSDQLKDLAFYCDCHDPSLGHQRQPVEDLSRIIRVDYKLVSLSTTRDGREGQLRILQDWLTSNSPLKLLHVSIDQYDTDNSLELMRTLSRIEWTTMLSIEIFDKSAHRQNGHYVDSVVDLFRPIIRRCLTAELHSEPSNNLGGRCFMWDLKNPQHPLSEYTVINYNYINFIDAIRSGRLTGF